MQELGRRSVRIPGFDYSQPGFYFITICCQNRASRFGRLVDEEIRLHPLGELVANLICEIPYHFNQVALDEYVVMPNHLHMILELRRGTACRAPTEEAFGSPVPGSIPTIVRSLKSAATQAWRRECEDSNVVIWQRNYYDRIIRDEDELMHLRRYIRDNPRKWELDQYFIEP